MRALINHLALAWPLAKRDVMARYRGSVAGVLWALIGPLATVVIYSAVFQGVFKARWAEESVTGFNYAMRLFAGLIVFQALTEVATRATRLIQDNANLVKRVVFPLELLCVALVMQVAVHAALQLLVLGALQLLFGGGVGASLAWLLLALPWIVALMLATALGATALGCYVRDLQHLIPLLMSGLLFLSPVFYPQSMAPPALQLVLALNPLSGPIEVLRAAWFGGAYDWIDALPPLAAALLALALMQVLFARLRPGFADQV